MSHDDHSSMFTGALDLGPSFTSAVDRIVDHVKASGSNHFGSFAVNIGNVIKFIDALDEKLHTKLYREIIPSDVFQIILPIIYERRH